MSSRKVQTTSSSLSSEWSKAECWPMKTTKASLGLPARLPPHKLNNPSIIAAREIWSYALIPSMDNTVASGFNSLSQTLDHVGDALAASTRGESILVRSSGSHSSCDQSPHNVAHHNPQNSSICLAQRPSVASTIDGACRTTVGQI